MRSFMPALLAASLALIAPVYGQASLIFTLDSGTGSGSPASLNPSANPPCFQPNCVLFTGTLFDSDTDLSYLYLSAIGVTFSSGPSTGYLTLDNTFYTSVPGIMSGDPNYATDSLGNPANSYSGPVFGIDIAPGTPFGVYTGTVTVSAAGGTGDPGDLGFTVTQGFTVDVVAPEPATGGLALAGFAALWKARWRWRSSAS